MRQTRFWHSIGAVLLCCGLLGGCGDAPAVSSAPSVSTTESTPADTATTSAVGSLGPSATATTSVDTSSTGETEKTTKPPTSGTVAPAKQGLLGVTFSQSAGDILVDYTKKTVTIPVKGNANLQGKLPTLQVSAGYTATLSNEGGKDLNAELVYTVANGKVKESWRVMTTEIYADIPEVKSFSVMSLFGDGAVLQRDKPIRVWGTCEGGDMVTVEFAGQKRRGAVQNGRWEVVLDALPASTTPRDMTITTAGRSVTRKNMLVGDVWVCSGQSNMVHFVKYLDESYWAEYQAIADNQLIRYFYVPNSYDKPPLDDFVALAKWTKPSVAKVLNFSAYAYGFAYRVQKELGIPVGIIDSSVGASIIEEWLPDPCLTAAGTSRQEALHNQELPQYGTGMYNSMIYPMRGLSVKGVLWYQGESNVNATSDYKRLFAEFVRHYRELFGDTTLPIISTQIVKHHDVTRPKWPDFRVIQWEAARETDTYIVCGIDLGDRTNIHPNDKLPLAYRAADLALNKVYGKQAPGESAYPVSAAVSGTTVTLRFRDAESGLKVLNDGEVAELYGRTAEGDSLFPQTVTLQGDTLSVTFKKAVAKVEYAMSWMPEGNLYTENGLPVAPFSWKISG